jgi:hypothetical protein
MNDRERDARRSGARKGLGENHTGLVLLLRPFVSQETRDRANHAYGERHPFGSLLSPVLWRVGPAAVVSVSAAWLVWRCWETHPVRLVAGLGMVLVLMVVIRAWASSSPRRRRRPRRR